MRWRGAGFEGQWFTGLLDAHFMHKPCTAYAKQKTRDRIVNARARMSGRLIGVGTGPGDPELLTLKAVRALGEADVVAHFAKDGRNGNARATVAGFLRPGVEELALRYPVTTEVPRHEPAYCAAIEGFYARSAAAVEAHLAAGRTVAVLSEGDPLFYGSYMHLHVRLAPRYEAEVIPGVTAMSGSWSQAGLPLVQGDDVLSVLPGTLSGGGAGAAARAVRGGGDHEGGAEPREDPGGAGGGGEARAGGLCGAGDHGRDAGGRLAEKADDRAPYFSLVLVPGWEGRP